MGLSNYVSTYQNDFSTASKGFRGRRSLSASNLSSGATGSVATPMMLGGSRPMTRGGREVSAFSQEQCSSLHEVSVFPCIQI